MHILYLQVITNDIYLLQTFELTCNTGNVDNIYQNRNDFHKTRFRVSSLNNLPPDSGESRETIAYRLLQGPWREFHITILIRHNKEFASIETVSPEGTFCDTVQFPSRGGDMELI